MIKLQVKPAKASLKLCEIETEIYHTREHLCTVTGK